MKKILAIIGLTALLVGCGNETNIAPGQDSSESTVSSESREASMSSIEEPLSPEEELLKGMTLEEKVGQLFLARKPDIEALEMAQNYALGGYIWFARDFFEQTSESIQAEVSALQESAPYGMFQAVDEEGGTVTRISSYPQYRNAPFASPQEVFELGGWRGIATDASEKAVLLKELGFNLNLAPVADIPVNETDFIYERAFSTNPDEVSQFVETVVNQFQEAGVGSVLKHFPGYSDNVDTHVGVAYDERPYETFFERDFLPFETGIESGVEGILVAHNVIDAIDPTLPATLSPNVISILREDLKFNGLIITDDLIMEGLTTFASPEEAAVLAVLAGNDLLISSDFTVQVPAVLQALEDGRIMEERIDESVVRILTMKRKLGILP